MCIKFDAWCVIASFYYDYLEDITKIGKQISQEMERLERPKNPYTLDEIVISAPSSKNVTTNDNKKDNDSY